MEEMIEEVTWEGQTVAVHPKSRLKENMFPHKVSLVIPRGEDGKFIFSRRAKDKWPYPDVWVCAIGGKVAQGETYTEAAHRETLEEANIQTDLEKMGSFKYDGDEYKAIFQVFTTKQPVSMDSLKADPSEIQYFQAFGLEEIKKNISEDPEEFAPTFRAAVQAFIVALETKTI